MRRFYLSLPPTLFVILLILTFVDLQGANPIDTKVEAPESAPLFVAEICNNGIDDDGDGLTDCADPDCESFAGCSDCFACAAELYQRVDQSLKILDPTSGVYDSLTIAGTGFQGGYNVQDGKIYGKYNDDSLYVQTRSGFSGIAKVIGTDIGSGIASGDFDLNGNLHLYSHGSDSLFVIDVDATSPITPTKILLTTVGGNPNNIFDIAYNKYTDKFYGLDKNEDLYAIDVGAETITFLADYSSTVDAVSSNNQSFGAAWIDTTGTLFFSRNSTGELYSLAIDTATGTLGTFQYLGGVDVTGNNDGFSCPLTNTYLTEDRDGDGNINFQDLDADNDGIADTDEGSGDIDNDGIPNYLDLDSDNDGIPDIVEAGGIDVDGDGRVDFSTTHDVSSMTDVDNDGYADIYDNINGAVTSGSPPPTVDSDGDGIDDHLDLDSDNDGIPDLVEAGGIDTDGNGMVDDATDIDNDGLADIYDENADDGPGGIGTDGTALVETSADTNADGLVNSTESMTAGSSNTVDQEGDNIPNHLDLDADNDGIPDVIEGGGVDANGDGRADDYTDSDTDGFSDVYDPTDNMIASSNDVTFAAQANNPMLRTNADADSDGVNDAADGYAEGDLDGDNYPNFLDIDADNDGILDIVEADAPSADANGDGYVDDYNPGTGAFGGSGDADGDGYSNEYDSDTNNDGTANNAQSLSGGAWVSGPLILTGADTDVDGLPDNYANGDTDSDTHPDFLDADTDNDGILDNHEAQATGQSGTQSYVANASTVDSKGVPTPYSSYTNYDTDNSTSLGSSYGISPYDHDGDGTADYKDSDSDGDGDPDVDEAWDSNLDGDGTSDYSCSTDVDGDGLLSCFDSDDADATVMTNANTPPVDNGFETTVGNGSTAASTFASLNGTSVLYYDVFPNNSGDGSDIQPDWRDDNSGCVTGASLQYPLTGTDAIYTGSSHASNPSQQVGAIRACDYCDGLVEAGWRYYFDPVNPAKVLFSIEHGSNTTQIDYIEMRRDTSSARRVTNGATDDGFFVMARDWFVQTVDDAALTANVNIRFYFDPTDSTAMQTKAEAYSQEVQRIKGDVVWFKTDDQFLNAQISAADGLSNLTGYTTMTPAAYGVEGSLHYVQFNNLTGFSGGGLGVPINGSLPVEWLDFSAEVKGATAELNWITSSEENSDVFIIERSTDAQLYEQIGEVKAAGNSSSNRAYRYQDESIKLLSSEWIYYRLRQVDLDGKYEYSEVREVRMDEQPTFALKAFPNPADQAVSLDIRSIESAQIKLEVMNQLGQVILRKSIDHQGGTERITLNISEWPRGNYWARIINLQKQTSSISSLIAR